MNCARRIGSMVRATAHLREASTLGLPTGDRGPGLLVAERQGDDRHREVLRTPHRLVEPAHYCVPADLVPELFSLVLDVLWTKAAIADQTQDQLHVRVFVDPIVCQIVRRLRDEVRSFRRGPRGLRSVMC